jgi:recombination protein RecT
MSENALTTTEDKNTLQGLLSSNNIKKRLEEILGKNAATFATSVIQITKSNKLLVNAEPASIVGAAMTAATLNLPLNNSLGYAYIIPFNERQENGQFMQKAQFQIGYKGFIQLAMRSGQFKTIHTTDVKQGEVLERNRLSGDITFQWIEDDAIREKTETIGYVAYFRLLNGHEATLFMSMKELDGHGKRFSQTFKKNFGLWKDDFDSMAKKTVLKLLLSKYAPLSIDMQTAVKTDQASFNDAENIDDINYTDNEVKEIDPDLERMNLLVKDAKTQEDIDFAREHVTDKVLLAELDLKEVQIKKGKK